MYRSVLIFVLGLILPLNSYAECRYLPQGLLTSWSQDRSLWDREVSYEPVIKNQVLEGFEITHLDSQNFLYQAGLRDGQVLTHLNSVPVAETERFSDLVEGIGRLSVLELQFENRENLTFQVNNGQCFN